MPIYQQIRVACQECSLAALCLPMGLTPEDIDRLDAIVQRNRPLNRGDHVFRESDPLQSLYAVKTGSVKTYTQDAEGGPQVLGFHLPGELLGLDAIQSDAHNCSAVALETTVLCELPYDRLEDLSSDIPSLQRQMFRILSRELNDEAMTHALHRHGNADQRLAAFLLSLSSRFQARGFSPNEFFLSMSRDEIGNYLGMALETVSRQISRFQDNGLIRVERKFVQLLDLDGLRALLPKAVD